VFPDAEADFDAKFDDGGGVLPKGWRDMAHPGYDEPIGSPSPTRERAELFAHEMQHSAPLGSALVGAGAPAASEGIRRALRFPNQLKGEKRPLGPPPPATSPETWYGFAGGGDVGGPRGAAQHVAGPVHGPGGGRADDVDMSVKSGSYVIPADCVSGLAGADGNTNAGMAMLAQAFGPSDPAAMAAGGDVPIKISDGEFVLSPDQVARVGSGDLKHGHRVLDAFVKKCRAEHIKTLSRLPGPAQ